jgi:hypothetical protein
MEIIKMKKPVKKIIKYILVVVILCFVLYFVFIKNEMYKVRDVDLLDMVAAIEGYISENNGQFPLSEQDLIDKGFLRIEKTSTETVYKVRIDYHQVRAGYRVVSPNWSEVYFDKYKILYGASTDNIRLEGDMLYSVDTNQPVLLIAGPYKKYFKHSIITGDRTYEEFSVELYKMMLEYQKPKIEQEGTITKPEQIEIEESN